MRTRLIACSLLCVAASILNGRAAAQEYPARTVRIVVPFTATGGTDIIGRALAQRLSETLGQQFIVDNRPGGNGLIGAEIVARAAPDGYVLLLSTNGLTI